MLLSLHDFRELVEQALPSNADHVLVVVPGVPWYDALQGRLRFDPKDDVKTIYKCYDALEEYVEEQVEKRLEEERAHVDVEE